MSTTSNVVGSVFDSSVQADGSGSVVITGDLTVEGTTTTVESTSVLIEDKIIELAHGTSGTPSGDAGIIVERGSSTNSALIWDESTDTWNICTTSATGASSGDLTTSPAALSAAAITSTITAASGCLIDQNFSVTDASSTVALDIDFDKTGASITNNTMVGINVDMDNTTATAGTNAMTGVKVTPTCTHPSGSGTVNIKGAEIIATGSPTPEVSTVRALDLTATGGDYNQGILINTDDANGWDMKIVSSADTSDHCTIAVAANGATTLTTTDGGGANADLTFAVNGSFDVTATSASFASDVTLGEGKSLSIGTPLLPTTDHTSTGLSAQMLAGGAIGAFQTVCVHTTTGEVVITDSNAIATMPVIGIAPAAISDTATGTILLQGFIRDDTWNWTLGGIMYASETAGAMTQTAPTTSGAFVQALGIALSADVVYFNPSLTLVEVA
tara:strand:+ start:5620 stop:6951 length:1332 start_codon:yes stop_codon:yes gene_type:complete